MRNKSLSNRYLTILFSILICVGMILSSCSKSDSDSETKKSKKTKKTEVSEVAEEETESETPKETAATTESETEPPETTTEASDPERVRLAGTYEGYATQTKAESHPEKGSLNNYAILRNDGSFRLVLNEDGTGKWEDSMNGSYDISEWTATGDSVTITLPDRTVPGTIKNDLVCMNDTDMYWYYGKDGADTSIFNAITSDEALVVTGDDYYFGIGPEGYNLEKARAYYQSAADAGVGKGYYGLGRIYADRMLGGGGQRTTAITYYDKAIELGCPYGYVGKGRLYEWGTGVDLDYATAFQFYKTAADNGCLLGYACMAFMIQDGVAPGYARNGQTSIEYCQKGLQSNDWYDQVYSMYILGYTYVYPRDDLAQDTNKAVEWLVKASDMGFNQAMQRIGDLYYYGTNISKDYGTAIYWYQKAFELGDPKAARMLGHCYTNGYGTATNYAEGFRYYTAAATNGDALGAYNLAICYEYGRGTDVNMKEAFDWMQIAADEKIADAYCELGFFYEEGEAVTQDFTKAFDCWVKGSTLGSEDCSLYVAECYVDGDGVALNYSKALDFYALGMSQAYNHGNDETYEYCQQDIAWMVEEGYITQAQADAAVGYYFN
ncbi:MAG: sel1 repeat family protein [Clostridiales bacterium]|nr:sel1 repeat family protein [Clostridiales bacterium]